MFSLPTLQFSRETTPNLLETFSEAILVSHGNDKRLFGDFHDVKRGMFGYHEFGLVAKITIRRRIVSRVKSSVLVGFSHSQRPIDVFEGL